MPRAGQDYSSYFRGNRVDPFTGYGRGDTRGMDPLRQGEQAGGALMGQGTDAMAQSLAMYNALANGQGPSLATNLARQQTAQNIASQQAMLAQGRGGSAASQQRNAALAGQGLQAQSAADVANIRSQEQLAAMGGAAQLGTSIAGLGAQQQLGYAGMLNQAQISQMNTQAQFELQQRALQQAERQGRFQRNFGWANLGRQWIGDVVNGIEGGMAGGAMSDERLKTGIMPASSSFDDSAMRREVSEALGPRPMPMQGARPMPQMEAAPQMEMAPLMGLSMMEPNPGQGVAPAVGGRINGGGLAASDERLKQGLRSETAGDLAGSMRPVSFEYTPGAGPPGRRVGILAQDLEQTPAGRALVIDTPQGKMIDTPQATNTALAMIADQEQRLRRLEGGGQTVSHRAPQRGQAPMDRGGVAYVNGTGSGGMNELAAMDRGIYGPDEARRLEHAARTPDQRALYNNMLETQERTTYLDEAGNRRLRDRAIGQGAPFEEYYISPDDRDAIAMGEELAAQDAERARHDARTRADAKALAGQLRKLPKPLRDRYKESERNAALADAINRLRQITEAARPTPAPDRRI